jgi:hypothetical protein
MSPALAKVLADMQAQIEELKAELKRNATSSKQTFAGWTAYKKSESHAHTPYDPGAPRDHCDRAIS